MGILLSLKIAIKSIFSNKLRNFITMLGVIIGVASVIAAVGFAKGSTSSITSSLESTRYKSNINYAYGKKNIYNWI